MTDWIKVYDNLASKNDDPRFMMGYQKDGIPVSWSIMFAIQNDIRYKLELDQDKKLLDVGSGIGICSLYNNIIESYNIDTSFSMLKKSSLENKISSEMSKLPFKDKTFDRLLCYSVFHYLSDYSCARQVISEFLRVLKNNGVMMIGDIVKESTNPCQLSYEPEFFKNYNNIMIYEQDIPGIPKSRNRYDVIIHS